MDNIKHIIDYLEKHRNNIDEILGELNLLKEKIEKGVSYISLDGYKKIVNDTWFLFKKEYKNKNGYCLGISYSSKYSYRTSYGWRIKLYSIRNQREIPNIIDAFKKALNYDNIEINEIKSAFNPGNDSIEIKWKNNTEE